MKKLFLLLYLIIINSIINSQGSEFAGLLKKMSAEFIMPAGFKETAFVDQYDVKYDYALKHIDEEVEIRIAVFPQSMIKNKYTKSLKEKSAEIEKNIYMNALIILFNITQRDDIKPDIRFFNEKNVKDEFGADKGITVTVEGNSEFSGNYKYVMVNGIYKEDLGIIYIFFLFNDMKKIFQIPKIAEAYYCVKYK